MQLWRISNYADLLGEGGRQNAARWNSAGLPIVYLSEHPALALLENLVHLEGDADDLPDTYQLLEAETPDRTAVEEFATGDLDRRNPGWRRDVSFTRGLGDAWLKGSATALLKVPSVVIAKSTNVLLNPAHADARKVRIVGTTRPAYDRRLFGGN